MHYDNRVICRYEWLCWFVRSISHFHRFNAVMKMTPVNSTNVITKLNIYQEVMIIALTYFIIFYNVTLNNDTCFPFFWNHLILHLVVIQFAPLNPLNELRWDSYLKWTLRPYLIKQLFLSSLNILLRTVILGYINIINYITLSSFCYTSALIAQN